MRISWLLCALIVLNQANSYVFSDGGPITNDSDHQQPLNRSRQSLEETIRIMFERGYGMLLLAEPVAAIAEVDSLTAKKMVVEQTRNLCESRGWATRRRS